MFPQKLKESVKEASVKASTSPRDAKKKLMLKKKLEKASRMSKHEASESPEKEKAEEALYAVAKKSFGK